MFLPLNVRSTPRSARRISKKRVESSRSREPCSLSPCAQRQPKQKNPSLGTWAAQTEKPLTLSQQRNPSLCHNRETPHFVTTEKPLTLAQQRNPSLCNFWHNRETPHFGTTETPHLAHGQTKQRNPSPSHGIKYETNCSLSFYS